MMVHYNCKYFTHKDRCVDIIKTINEKILKYEETDRPSRTNTVRRSVNIKSLVLKLYGTFLWKYDSSDYDLNKFSNYYENIIQYLYKLLRYKGDILKTQNVLTQSEKNKLLYTAIFQMIKAARKRYI